MTRPKNKETADSVKCVKKPGSWQAEVQEMVRELNQHIQQLQASFADFEQQLSTTTAGLNRTQE